MKTKYRFIHFEGVEEDPVEDTLPHWRCVNNKHKHCIGRVEWYPQWKMKCFFPKRGMVFSKDCLEDICDFIKQLGGKDEKRS